MSRSHYWTWVGVVCLFGAAAVCAPQDQSAVSGSSNGASAVAAVPRLIKFSGRVLDARGEPLGSVAVRLTFAVYQEQTGGAALWVETQMLELDEQGQYSVLLGATRSDGLPVELFPAGKARWLGVQVEGRDEDPRVLLVSVPYALKSEDAAKLGGRSASDFVLTEQLKEEVKTQVEAQKPGITAQAVEMLVNNPPNLPAITEGPSTFTCATTGDCVAVTQSSTGRALRATATSASEAALLQQNGTGYGLRVLSQNNYAIYGVVQGAVVGTTYGVRGLVNSTTGAGILGSNTATTGVAYGLMGQTSSVSGIGLYGRALATTGTTAGLTGDADSTSGKGIMGRATATSGTTMGIYGEARSASGTALVVNNTAGGKLLSGQAGGVEKFSIAGNGNLTTSGSVTAASFSGGGTLSGTQLVSTVASGTAPLSVTSNTLVPSLNADLLDGLDASAFQPAGSYAILGANTFTATQTVSTGDLSVSSGDISLPETTSASSGVINLGGSPFIHAYGSNNTFVGASAGNFTTTGADNTADGYMALASNTSGDRNTASGYAALHKNTSGLNNVASGYRALYNNTANDNTAIGTYALESNIAATRNTAVGNSALYYNCWGVAGCTANNNTAVGYQAGASSTAALANKKGSNNTFIGYFTGPGVDGNLTPINNATAIGAYAAVSASNSLVLGSINGVNGASASVNVGIGTPTPTTPLHVASGDIYASQAGSGVIVKSPDGTTCARIGIDDTGALSVTALTCP